VQIVESVGMDMRSVNHCELAVDEAITNIIEHGYGETGANKVVDIVIKQRPDQVTIIIMDDGPPHDPLNNPEPDPLADLEERAENNGGWGVFFIKKVMDDVRYKYAANRNHLIMTKQIA